MSLITTAVRCYYLNYLLKGKNLDFHLLNFSHLWFVPSIGHTVGQDVL